MRNAGLVEFRRHDPDVVRQRARNLLDDLQARRMDTVIIGAENSHPLGDLFERFPGKYHGAVLSVDHGSGKPRKKAAKSQLLPTNDIDCGFCLYWKALWLSLFCWPIWGWRRGLMMTRFFAAAAISICSLFSISVPANAQTDSDCFPWQEMRDGRC